jgi:putative ABC transport system permease protein
MELLKLIVLNAGRHKLRSCLTILGVAVAVLAFCMLRTLVSAWHIGADASSPKRLITRNKISLVNLLPVAYRAKILRTSGVSAVGHGLWFAGVYKDKKNFFAQFAVSGRDYLDLYPEFMLTEPEKVQFERERNACVVGRKLADRFSWKVGDIIRLKGTIFPVDLDLVLRGVYRGAHENTDETAFFFRYDLLNERLKTVFPQVVDKTGWFLVQIRDAERAAEISLEIDGQFANSLAETVTETEKAFQLGFIAMTEAIVTAIRVISMVVIVIILIVLGNTMAMTARERSQEYAALKTLGFRSWFLFRLIAGESLAIAACGGLLGVLCAYPAAKLFHGLLSDFLPVFRVDASTLAVAAAASLTIGLLAALAPAIRVSRMSISEGLRHLG